MESKLKILIVDEDLALAQTFETILKLIGDFETYTASTNEDAFKILEEKRPEICIIELYEKGFVVDGVAVLRKIKEDNLRAISLMMVCRDAPRNEVGRAQTWGAYAIGNRNDAPGALKRFIPEMVDFVRKKRQNVENKSKHNISEEKMERSLKVLIVDDENGLADFMHRILALRGYTAFMETDGIYALNFFKRERPNIVVIDVDLGHSEIDGVELLRRIKEIDKDTVCIMLTRITDENSVTKSKEYGALHYLLKPLDSTVMVDAVDEAAALIEKRRAS